MNNENKKSFEALNEGDCFDFRHNKNPKCPHCGKEVDVAYHELWELYDDVDAKEEIECPYCDKDFEVQVICTYRFSTDDQSENFKDGDA